ncbi:MAG: ATP-binding protein [Deltaproteobacteria bacterium]|nr:ATP-binding protein [Deltaproteobacteria bacterium]MBL7112940.1 ATP-binding protein [Bacteroidales bacterium]
MKDLLKTIIFDQQTTKWSAEFVKREISEKFITSPEIIVISGIRRCGKSTLLLQIRKDATERDFFMNFDDERLVNFTVADFQILHETFIELFGNQTIFYFDEIQNIPGWERFIRRLHDHGNKVFLTGSNATMLSRELGSHLTGRHLSFELFPFSFREYLAFISYTLSSKQLHSTTGKSMLQRHFNDYFQAGGFPGYLKTKNDEYLKSLYQSILYRDVMVRNRLTNEKELLELVYFLASNTAKLSSNNSLTKVAGVKNATTIRNYIEFLENTYLLFQVYKFDHSVKNQIRNAKKTYFIDNALIHKLGFLFSDESGRLLENLVFIELKRRGKEVFYHANLKECDFIIKQGTRITQAIQVCHAFDSPDTFERELSGLMDALATYQLNEGYIITTYTEEEILRENKKIHIKSAWKWLLEG